MTVEMEMDGADVRERGVPPLAACAATRGSPTARSTSMFAGRARAEEPWAEPLEAAREVAARAARAARLARDRQSSEPTFEFDADGHVTGVRYEQQTESHRLIEQLMILANEQVAGYLADRRLPTLYRVHERPEPQSVDVPGRAAGEPRHPDAAAAEADDPAAGGRRSSAEIIAHRGARVRDGRTRASASLVLRSLKQAYYSPKNLGPRRARQRALLPLHVADPPLPGRGGAPRAAPGRSASTTPRRAAARAGGGRPCELLGDRARGDADRARRRRRLPRLPARARAGRGEPTSRRASRARSSA